MPGDQAPPNILCYNELPERIEDRVAVQVEGIGQVGTHADTGADIKYRWQPKHDGGQHEADEGQGQW